MTENKEINWTTFLMNWKEKYICLSKIDNGDLILLRRLSSNQKYDRATNQIFTITFWLF